MNRRTGLRLLTAILAAAMAFAVLCGCGKNEETSKTEADIMEEQGVPDIFIEESQQLGSQETPPTLVIETTNGEAVTATYATLGGYVWEWLDSDGRKQLAEEEAPCAADMKEIAVVKRSDTDGKAAIQITGGTLRSVQMWPDGAPMEEGERLAIEGDTILFPASGEYRYEVVVDYPGGRVYYAFMLCE